MKRALILLLALALLGAAGTVAYLRWRDARITAFAQRPFGHGEPTLVDVPQGTGPRKLSTLLAERGAVQDAELFYAFIRREEAGPRLKAGEYELQGPLTPAQVLEKLVTGQVKAYHFTVPEGLRAEEILPLLARSELGLDLGELTRHTQDVAFLRKAGVPVDSVEGFLYPDTYTFTRPFSEEAVLRKMISRTLEEYRKAEERRKPGNKLGLLETITLASIIEKETGAPPERPRISCVFHNRLRLGMKLQTDPTVLYAMRLLRGHFTRNITSKDLTTEHPYNTYTVRGLPPGPIASPGAAAIQAALDPIDCQDLYFVSRNDGTHEFCPDLACHNAAVERWQRAYWRKRRNR